MNSMVKTVLTTLVASCFATATLAQGQAADSPTPPKPVCESATGFSDFDFWLGEWDVYTNDDTRKLQGSNSITKHHKNCLVMENWTSVQGGTGRSMNYFDPVEGHWRQLWVAGGYSIDYTGGLNESGSMVLNGKINYYNTGKSHAFRGTWTPPVLMAAYASFLNNRTLKVGNGQFGSMVCISKRTVKKNNG